MFAKEQPNFGPLHIRNLEEIKKGMILAAFEDSIISGYLKFMRVVEPPHSDRTFKRLCIKVEREHASAQSRHSVHRSLETEDIELAQYGVVPYKDGTWNDDRCLIRVDENGCIPDELLPKNYTPEAEERRGAEASGKWTRKCVHWQHTVKYHRSLALEFCMDRGKCEYEEKGKLRRCGQIDATPCGDYEEPKPEEEKSK